MTKIVLFLSFAKLIKIFNTRKICLIKKFFLLLQTENSKIATAQEMNLYLFRTTNYLLHHFRARHTLGYNVHSPMLYDFTRNVIYEDNPYYIYRDIEHQRQLLLNSPATVFVEDYGTGQSGERKIKDIALTSLASPAEGQLLFRIANCLKATHILELGTSLGISTAYLAAHNSKCRVTTLEGSKEIAAIARQQWKKLNFHQQINTITGNIDDTLPLYLKETKQNFDIIYFDANHTHDATLKYFRQCLPYRTEHSVFIFDDIYLNPGMKQAWQQITQEHEVTASIDLYHLGIVFFNPHLIKKTYYMRW